MPFFSNPSKTLESTFVVFFVIILSCFWQYYGWERKKDANFQLKLATKQMGREALKAEKAQRVEEGKIKKAIQQGNQDCARLYAENAIRKKSESLNYHRMASRLDAVSQRIQTAITMRTVTKSMGATVKGMDAALQSMDLPKITAIMDTFERQFDDLDVQTGVMDKSVSGMGAITTPEDQVDALINKVADEHGLELAHGLDIPLPSTELSAEKDAQLLEKLKALRDSED